MSDIDDMFEDEPAGTLGELHLPNPRGRHGWPPTEGEAMTTPSTRATVASADRRTAVDAAVVDAMIEHGPDGHIDGHEQITDAVLDALAPFVAAREAQAAAKALREAAEAAMLDRWSGWKWVAEAVANWLRARADRIERGESS